MEGVVRNLEHEHALSFGKVLKCIVTHFDLNSTPKMGYRHTVYSDSILYTMHLAYNNLLCNSGFSLDPFKILLHIYAHIVFIVLVSENSHVYFKERQQF